jgi:hypothetical protein
LIERESPGSQITIGSDHPFRHPLVLEYYRRRLAPDREFHYSPPEPWPPAGPQWVLIQSFEPDFHPAPTLTDPQGHEFELVQVYPYAGLSGWNLALYRNPHANQKP